MAAQFYMKIQIQRHEKSISPTTSTIRKPISSMFDWLGIAHEDVSGRTTWAVAVRDTVKMLTAGIARPG